MKKIKLIVITMLLLTCAFMLMGFDSTQKKVYDDAGILTSSEESKLQQLCVDTAQASQIDIIIVTTKDNQGKSAMKYAEDFFVAHDFGYDKKGGDGVLFLIDMQGRETWIATSGSGIKYISDTRIDNIVTATTTYLKKSDYSGACESFVNKIGTYMKTLPSSIDQGGDGNTTYTYDNKTFSEKLLDNMLIKVLIAVAVGAIVVIIMMFNAKAKVTVGCQTYVKDHKFDVRDTRDIFINTTVVTRKIVTNNGNGSGGGSSHTGSGGNSFGGGGGKF